MKIALVWYGRMWKLVEIEAKNRWYEVSLIVSPSRWNTIKNLLSTTFDVVVDFSKPEVALENLKFYAENDIKVVMATTGWYKNLEDVKLWFKNSKWALLWSSNFSLWVHIFWKIVESGAKIINKFDAYDVFWHEFHHNKKADSPSGTAITTANILLTNIDRKEILVTEELKNRPIFPEELHFSSSRWGSIPWIHEVYFDSPFDTIEIKHTARTREWFALWSIVCAEWVQNKTWYFEIDDFIKEVI